MRRRPYLAVFLLCASALLAAFILTPVAVAQDSASTAGLTVLGPANRTVPFFPTQTGAKAKGRTGVLNVIIQNTTDASGTLQLKYFTADGTTVRLTPPHPSQSQIVSLARSRESLTLDAGDSRQVQLSFQLRRNQALHTADGILFARMVPVQVNRSDPPSVVVHVLATVGTATFTPNPAKLQLKTGCWFSPCDDATTLTLQGPDAPALAAQQRSGTATLSNDAGQIITATVTVLKPQGAAPGPRGTAQPPPGTPQALPDQAQVRVTGLAFGKVGTFAGKVGLGPTPARGPSVNVTVMVALSLGWLVLTLFVGSFLGGFLSLTAHIWRRRRLLKLELHEALTRYRTRLAYSFIQRQAENEPWVPYSYDLTPVLGREVRDAVTEELGGSGHGDFVAPHPNGHLATTSASGAAAKREAKPHYLMAGRSSAPEDTADNAIQAAMEPFPAERGVPSLLWHLGTARTDADFTDDAAVAHELIDCVDRWHDVEETCAVVHEVLKSLDDADAKQRHPPEAKGGRRFQDACPVAIHDLRVLRARAHELLLQGKRDELDKAADDLVRRINRQLLVLLQLRLIWTMDSILDDAGYWDPREVTTRELRRGEREKRSAEALDAQNKSEEERCKADSSRDAHVAFLAKVGESCDWYWAKFAKPDDWTRVYGDAFGVSTEKGRQRINQLAARAQRSGRVLPPPPRKGEATVRTRNPVTLSDLAWTMAIALVTVVAYALTLYSATWGSTTDILKAFAAAFVSASLVNWAALPAFQSIRSRWASSNSTEPPADERKPETPTADDKTSDSKASAAATPTVLVASAVAENGARSDRRESQPSLEIRFPNPP